MVIRAEQTLIQSGPTMNADSATVGNADFSAVLERDMAILGGALPPEVAAEIAALPQEERAMAEAAMEHLRAISGFKPGDQIATFNSPTRPFDMFNPHQAMDGIAEMIFRMMVLTGRLQMPNCAVKAHRAWCAAAARPACVKLATTALSSRQTGRALPRCSEHQHQHRRARYGPGVLSQAACLNVKNAPDRDSSVQPISNTRPAADKFVRALLQDVEGMCLQIAGVQLGKGH